MKNRNFLKNSIALLLPISMGIGVLFGASNKHETEVSAYTKDGVLTSTIDLRDNTPQEIRQYYSSLSDLSTTDLQGNNLLKNLKPILKNGQKYFAYDSSGDDLWKMYEIIDRDWEKSPASAITGYSASTNKITGYTYGTSTSNKGTNPYIHALYVDRSVENETRAWDDHQQTQWGINREHIWPKSQGFNAEGAGGARGDPMHLWAGNGRVNGTEHNNNMYGFVDKSKSYTNPYDAKEFKNLKDNYSGKSLTVPSSTDTVFEPQDCDKGDIARSIFYMVARYNNLAGNDTIDTNNPNLALKQTTTALASYTTTSSNKQTGYMGLMTDLLYWNHLDPVDEFEIHRNNLLFNNYTYNRNPFIDFPEWADYIWGKPVYNGRNYVSYSSTPTGSVNLSTDVINGFKGEQPQQVTVTSIEVTTKPTKLVYNVGETLDTNGMVVKAHMSNNTTKVLSSSEYTVAPSGALKTTDTQVTVTYEGKTASFAIGVKGSGGGSQSESKEISINFESCPSGWPSGSSASANEKKYTIGNEQYTFSLGPNVYYNTSKYLMLKYTTYLGLPAIDGYKLTKVVAANSSGCSTSPKVGVSSSASEASYITGGEVKTWSTRPGTYTYELSHTSANTMYYLYITSANSRIVNLDLTYESVGGGTTSVDVSSITLNKNSTTLEIGQSDSLSATIGPENATIKLVSWSSSEPTVAEVSDEGEITAKSAGTATITCSALDGSGVTATCTVTVNAPVVLTSISLSGEYPTEFYIGDNFSADGLVVTANFSDNTHLLVTDDVDISGYDLTTLGQQTVTVAYGDQTTSYTIEVVEKGLASNEIMFIASQLGLVNGDDLTSYTDSIATLSFAKNSSGNPPKYYSSSSSFRVYAKNSFTIVGTKNIVKIEFEMASNDAVGSNTISASNGSLTGNTWTGSSSSVTFTIAGTSGQRNIKSIKITYDETSQDVKVLSSISLSGSYKTEFFKDETFSYEGLEVMAHYTDGTSEAVSPTSVSSPTMTVGTKYVTVSYNENGVTKTADYQIEVIEIVATSIELTGNYPTEFTQGDTFSTTGMSVVEHFNNGSTQNHRPSSCTITGYDMDVVGEQTVTVEYGNNSASYKINVKSNGTIVEQKSVSLNIGEYATANKIENGTKITTINANSEIEFSVSSGTNTGKYYSSGNEWRIYESESATLTIASSDNAKIKTVKITYNISNTGVLVFDSKNVSSGETVTINANSCVFSVGNTGTAANGQAKITNIEVTYEVTSSSTKTLSSVGLSGSYKTQFNVGDNFSFGGTVTATYSDESTEDVTNEASFSGYDLSTAGNQTVTVTYSDKTATYSITVTAPETKSYSLAGGKFFEGKYLIGFPISGSQTNEYYCMKAEISGSRFSYETVSINEKAITSNNLLEWVIEKDGDYYTLYNESTGKYAASTGTKNQGALQTSIDDKARWTLTYSSTSDAYSLINKYNSNLSTPVNSSLQNNGTYGFATYSYSASSALSLFKLDNTSFVKVNDVAQITEGSKVTFTATGSKGTYSMGAKKTEYYVGTSFSWDSTDFYYTSSEQMKTFTVLKDNEHFVLYDGEKYLQNPSGSNVASLVSAQNITDNARFDIVTVSGHIAFECIATGKYLKFNENAGSATSEPLFKFYAASGNYWADIYVDRNSGEANAWSAEFLKGTQGCVITDWNNYQSSYNDLSIASKTAIKGSIADQNGTLVEQAAARYDYIVGDPRFDVNAFITERAVAPASRNVLMLINLKDNPIIYIILFAIAGLTTIGAYIYVQRRKEQW